MSGAEISIFCTVATVKFRKALNAKNIKKKNKNIMKVYKSYLSPVILIVLMASCAPSTQLQKSWVDPSVNKATVKPFQKILVLVAFKDDASNRIAEDKIVAQIKKAVAVPAYSYLKPSDTNQKEVEERLKKDGFDAVILMRLKAVSQSTSYTPGTAYGGWYGVRYGSPGYVSVDKTFIVETNIYSLAEGKLLWSGTTSTLNPTKLDKTMNEIISTVKYDLQRKGLIK
jgi:hypothetical protein